jgi:cation:H+ antiporter
MPWSMGAAMGLTLLAAVLGGLPRAAGIALLAAYGAYVAFIG